LNALNVAPPVVSSSKSQPPRHRFVWNSRDLRQIKNPAVDLCVWQRGVDQTLALWLSRIAVDCPLSLDEVVPVGTSISDQLRGLPACLEREILATEVAGLVRLYGRLMQVDRVRLQLGAVGTRSCPKFHVDHVEVRMLCTFCGAGTEWIAEPELHRSRVMRSTSTLLPVRKRAHRGVSSGPAARLSPGVSQLERFDVALLKGSAYPGNERFGVVHRSPDVCSAEPRWVMVVDAK